VLIYCDADCRATQINTITHQSNSPHQSALRPEDNKFCDNDAPFGASIRARAL
jgi:hypothetical protein